MKGDCVCAVETPETAVDGIKTEGKYVIQNSNFTSQCDHI